MKKVATTSTELAPIVRPVRQCEQCQTVKTLSVKFFPRVPGCNTTLRFTCRVCIQEKKKRDQMQAIEDRAVDIYLRSSSVGGANIPHTAELLESVMQYFGGTNGFSSIIMKQYWDSPPGGRMRNSLLEMIVRLASKNTEQGGARKPINLFTEEEIESEINHRIEKAAADAYVNHSKRIVDATKATEATVPGCRTNPYAGHPGSVGFPEAGTTGATSGVEQSAARVLKAVSANGTAADIS